MPNLSGRRQRADEKYMHMALRLARKAPVLPFPNPWVGCVIEKNGKLIGRGIHRGAGTNHAEIEALAQAGTRASGATLYVNLEPCCHFGRTPPCTEAIIAAGIDRVVYALRDPNPAVAGRGASSLKRHGVSMRTGVLAGDAAALNEVYLKFRYTGLPFISAKAAVSLDGKIATRTGDSKWITDAAARRRARQLRAEHQAVLVGINTVLADNPHLGPRLKGAAEPWRIVLDSCLRIPLGSRAIRSGRCIVATTAAASPVKRKAVEQTGA
ncbi:MAG: bifunctional diaminohydroxyphosphoribosylaminopyrimidine deaminase/5-amino-6-(5-phosphoribosylamino)uracil reductase RibD, partial [Terriglobia bacterium]